MSEAWGSITGSGGGSGLGLESQSQTWGGVLVSGLLAPNQRSCLLQAEDVKPSTHRSSSFNAGD